ncbi:MAG: polymer-forming cytoskeletal protein [Proteobacteria bacterium]|nr:polymer-forming cytoskeletal protein [Pseudomonadota bacterium]
MIFSGLDFDFGKRWCDPAKTLFADVPYALGKLVFAQLTSHLPLSTLRRCMILVADEDLVIQGQIEGSILHTRSLTIGSQGRVHGDLRARRISVEGSVEGNLYALERASLRPGATVRGDIFAVEIVIDEGACLNGRIDMDNAPTVPTIKVPQPGSIEPDTSALSAPPTAHVCSFPEPPHVAPRSERQNRLG